MSLTSPHVQNQNHRKRDRGILQRPGRLFTCLSSNGTGRKETSTHQFLKEVSPEQRAAAGPGAPGEGGWRRFHPSPSLREPGVTLLPRSVASGLSLRVPVFPQQPRLTEHACGWPCVTE